MFETNFDGIPGPTHNYSGLARGNLASTRSAGSISNPREAALQGLAKMRALASQGFAQAVLPPHERPYLPLLRRLGFEGSDADVLQRAAQQAPHLLAASSSAAGMWVANAATVTASADSGDGRVHFTPANLVTHLHRSIETPVTTRMLRAIFSDSAHFAVHDPLPSARELADEGAANHTRLIGTGQSRGIDFLVYGLGGASDAPAPRRFAARQAREASHAIARRHGLDPQRVVFAQQHPDAIDAGVFHNDVIAVGSGNVLLCHEQAWLDQDSVLGELRTLVGDDLAVLEVATSELSLADAVSTYLFNSQLLRREDARYLLVAPAECREHEGASRVLDRLTQAGSPVAQVITFDLRQSMRNGGGPACLRLRVPLTAQQRESIVANVLLDDSLAAALEGWIARHYRDRLAPGDLRDPALLAESRRALDELTTLLRLPAIYDFQR